MPYGHVKRYRFKQTFRFPMGMGEELVVCRYYKSGAEMARELGVSYAAVKTWMSNNSNNSPIQRFAPITATDAPVDTYPTGTTSCVINRYDQPMAEKPISV